MEKQKNKTINLNNDEFDVNLNINSNFENNLKTKIIEDSQNEFEKINELSSSTQKIQEEFKKIKKTIDNKSLFEWIIMFFFLIIWSLIVVRVPYVGTFFDGVFFEFLFGWSKYLLYILVFFLILSIKSKHVKNFVFSKRKISWYMFLVFLCSIIISSVHFYTIGYNAQKYPELYLGSNGYLNNWESFFWLNTTKKFNVPYILNLTPHLSSWGGLFGLFFVSTFIFASPIILIFIFIFVLFIIGTKLFYKKHNIKWIDNLKNKIIRKSGGFTKDEININLGETLNTEISNNEETNEDLNEINDDENLINQIDSIIPVIKTMNTIDIFNIDDKFSDTNFIQNVLTKKLKKKFDLSKIEQSKNLIVNYKYDKLDNIKKKISAFINLQGFNYQFVGEQIRLQSIKLKYLFDNFDDAIEIKNSNAKLLDLINEKNIITYIGTSNELIIEVVIRESSQATLHDELSNPKQIIPYKIPVGKNDYFNTEYINLIIKTNLLIYGSVGSGKSMGLSSMLSYLLAISNKSFLNCEIIDLTSKTLKSFSNIDKDYVLYKTTEEELLNSLENFVNKIKYYNELLGDKFLNIYDYNDSVVFEEIIKNQVIVINEFNNLSSFNKVEIIKKIMYLLKYAKKFGFIIIIASSKINDDIKQLEKYMNNILYFKLDDESCSYINDNFWEAKYLVGKGDVLLVSEGMIYNLQSFIIKKDEINYLLNIEEQ